MRIIVLATLAAALIGLAGTSPGTAAPANGTAIDKAAASTSPITEVPCRWRKRCSFRHRARVCVTKRWCS